LNTRLLRRGSLALSSAGAATILFAGVAHADPVAPAPPQPPPQAQAQVTPQAQAALSPATNTDAAVVVKQEEMVSAPQRDWHAPKGLQLGARFGYTFGAGSVFSGEGVMDSAAGALPLIVDAGVRVLPTLYVGAYGQYAPVLFKGDTPPGCPSGAGCNGASWRFGVQFDIHFMPSVRWDPYIGLGAGYEILHTAFQGPATATLPSGTTASVQVDHSENNRGWEFANITLGADWRIDRNFGIGPFFTFTVGEFNVRSGETTVSAGGLSTTTTAPDVNHTTHELFIVGARGTFSPM